MTTDHPLLAGLRAFAAAQGIAVGAERPLPHGYQVKLARGAEQASVNLFATGTVQIQAKPGPLQQALDAWRASLGGTTTPRTPAAPSGTAPAAGLLAPLPHAGLDESGKGDYFGPLAVAAVAVDEQTAPQLVTLGVRDSKRLDDAAIGRIAARIRALCPHALVVIGPERYNELYIKLGSNLNRLLAWGHARALETLLEQSAVEVAIADQFADPARLRAALRERGRSIELIQQPRAEADIAVAAASILARAAFVAQLASLGRAAGVPLPAGASDTAAITRAGRAVLAAGGQPALAKVAKLHFKTTARILGTPEV